MNMLLEYVRNIGYFLILMSLVSNVMPDNTYKKYCRMFCGLILMVLVINPFYDFMNLEGDLSDAFANASYKSQVADLEYQLKNNDNNMNEKIMGEYEEIVADELQGIASEEGLYILDVDVAIEGEDEMKLTGLSILVTTDEEEYKSKQNRKDSLSDNDGLSGIGDWVDTGDISVKKIEIGGDKDIAIGNKKGSNMEPMIISFIDRVGEFLNIDTSIINVVVSEGE